MTVNGVAVEVSRWPSPQVAAVREWLRQRAIAVGLLPPEAHDEAATGAAIAGK